MERLYTVCGLLLILIQVLTSIFKIPIDLTMITNTLLFIGTLVILDKLEDNK